MCNAGLVFVPSCFVGRVLPEHRLRILVNILHVRFEFEFAVYRSRIVDIRPDADERYALNRCSGSGLEERGNTCARMFLL